MAVRVTPSRGMSAPTPRLFEAGTTYKFDGGRLDVYQGSKRIGTYAPGCWESVEVLELLDAPAFPKAVSKSADKIRTSPTRTRTPGKSGRQKLKAPKLNAKKL